MERPFAGNAGLESTAGERGGGGGGEEEEKEKEEEKKRRRRGEGRGETLGFRKAREKGEREDGGEALQRRGGTGEDARKSSRTPFNARARAPATALPSCKDTERHPVVANWEVSHIVLSFLFLYLFYWFVCLFVCVTQKVRRWDLLG